MQFTSSEGLLNKKIMITGASSGIGRAIAIECSRMGAIVFLSGRDKIRLQETLEMLSGDSHCAFVADINSSGQVDALIDNLPELDGVVNSAGVNIRKLCKYTKVDDLDWIIQTNLKSPILLMKKLLRAKKVTGGASIVFISSIAAFHGSIGDGVYSASKGGISSYAKVLALELAPKKIRVNTIQPGMVRTPFFADGPLTDDEYAKDEAKYPLGRYGKPEDIAYAAAFLLSDRSSWMTGADLIIDGGISLI